MSDIEFGLSEGVLACTFNRPQVMNALTWEMLRELRAKLRAAQGDRSVRVIVLRGVGDHFCAGADIRVEKNCSFVEYREFVSDIQDLTRLLQNLDAVTIAAIQGYCLGGGMEIACACDLRIAARDARLGFPEVGIGLTTTSGATHLVQRLVGVGRAKQLMLLGDWVTAEEAYRIGLVNRIVSRGALAEAVQGTADKILSRAPLAIATQKHLIDAAGDASLDATLRMEVDAILTTFSSRDGQEGMSAFIEKRSPNFVGE